MLDSIKQGLNLFNQFQWKFKVMEEMLLKEKTFTKNVENGPQSWENKQIDTYNPLKENDY